MSVWEIEFIAKTQYAEPSSAYRNNGNAPSYNIVALAKLLELFELL
jgi:hypothetical protein